MADNEKHIALVCNPTRENARALEVADEVVHLLRNTGHKYALFTAYWPSQLDEFTDVWIIGGDGTLNYFINQFPDTRVPLSVFRGGSGNDFHHMLYGEIDVEQQVGKLLTSSIVEVDAGICNGQLFLVGVGIGFDGAVVNDLLGKRKLAGKASYLLSILKHIIGYIEKHCVIEMNGREVREDCFLISVANSRRYGGGFIVAPKASLTDAKLDVNIVSKIHPLKRMKFLPVVERGEHLSLSYVQYDQSDKIMIRTETKLHAHMDGEYIFDDLFDIRSLPKRFLFSV
jgi:YegS/Rv2252/BmrU family lipid kinase